MNLEFQFLSFGLSPGPRLLAFERDSNHDPRKFFKKSYLIKKDVLLAVAESQSLEES